MVEEVKVLDLWSCDLFDRIRTALNSPPQGAEQQRQCRQPLLAIDH